MDLLQRRWPRPSPLAYSRGWPSATRNRGVLLSTAFRPEPSFLKGIYVYSAQRPFRTRNFQVGAQWRYIESTQFKANTTSANLQRSSNAMVTKRPLRRQLNIWTATAWKSGTVSDWSCAFAAGRKRRRGLLSWRPHLLPPVSVRGRP